MAGIKLVVIHPFGDYSRGDEISDDKTIADVLSGENAGSVNKVAAPAAAPVAPIMPVNPAQ
jgi:hypothetical protein